VKRTVRGKSFNGLKQSPKKKSATTFGSNLAKNCYFFTTIKKVQQTFLKSRKRYMMIKRPHPPSQIKKTKEKSFMVERNLKEKTNKNLPFSLKNDDFQLKLLKNNSENFFVSENHQKQLKTAVSQLFRSCF